jgi:dUTP pyrophosphatase
MTKLRGFEIAKGFEDKDIHIPERKTAKSAGYDIEAAEDTVIPPFKSGCKPTLVKTGLKAYCQDNEWYMLANRSSNPGKKHLVLANGIGIIDADYYNNPDNDGHFMFAYFNMSDEDVILKKGEVAGQLVFMNYLTTDDDNATGERTGGFGSTNKN